MSVAERGIRKSQRFARAARAERDRLARRRAKISTERDDLQRRIDALDAELEAVDTEIEVLAGYAQEGSNPPGQMATLADASVLSGAAIRRRAVPLLLRERGEGPIHYRQWFELLVAEGFSVKGNRPDAVFLNQVVRSPLVRATTRAGFYEIDRQAEGRLRAHLRELQEQLATTIRTEGTGEDFDDQRSRQRELNKAIAKAERELKEASEALVTLDSSEVGLSQIRRVA
jgi:hypothetical protein